MTTRDVIPVSDNLRARLESLLELLPIYENPALAEQLNPALDIHAVYNERGEVITGLLRLGPEPDGTHPVASINACTHHNEPAGLAVHQDMLRHWSHPENRPEGTLYLNIGGEVSRVREALEAILSGEGVTLEELTDFRLYNGLNYNRVEFDVLENPDQSPRARRAADYYHAVLKKANGNVMGIHTTSQPAEAILIPCTEPGHCDDEVLSRISHYAENMNTPHVTVDLQSRLSGIPMTGMWHPEERDHIPVVYEGGGPHLSERTFDASIEAARWFVNRKLGMELPLKPSEDITPTYYSHSTPIFLPTSPNGMLSEAMKQEIAQGKYTEEALRDDAFILLQGPEIEAREDLWTDHSRETLHKIRARGMTLAPDRLAPFVWVKEGEPLMIGQKTGALVTMPAAGAIMMAPASPLVPADQTESVALVAERVYQQVRSPQAIAEEARVANRPERTRAS